MENEKKNRKEKRKEFKEKNELESKENIEVMTKEKLKNYFGIEVSEISKENLHNFTMCIEKYENAIKLKESKNFPDLYELGYSNVKFIL
jgi:hypothetical protein